MPTLDIDGLTFTFPALWTASKFDEWNFYRHHFSRQSTGIKAVDAIAIDSERRAFLIEVKDYRHPETGKPSELPGAIANKVLHTLAAMLPAKLYALDEERRVASAVLKAVALRVVVHIELPRRHLPVVDLADVRQKLERLLRAIDAHPKVVSMKDMKGLPWVVA